MMRDNSLFVCSPLYRVPVCCKHRCAIYSLDKHLERYHRNTPVCQRRELLILYKHLHHVPLILYKHLHHVPLVGVSLPAPHSPPLNALQPAQDAFPCICIGSCSSSDSKSDMNSAVCGFISTSRAKMRQHVNQQHQVKLTRWSSAAAASYQQHAAKLWKPDKVQTFFRERRYVWHFVVQEEKEQEKQQGDEQQGNKQQDNEQRDDYKQTFAYLSSRLTALKRKDSEAIDRIAEEASAKDRTG
jgi:hypothetical protein